MKKLFVASAVALGLVCAFACSSKKDGESTGVSCTPGSRTICLCPSGEKGGWRCNAEGNGYGPCEYPEGSPCPEAKPDAGDPCAGTQVAISENGQSFTDDTGNGASIFTGLEACAGTDAKERVYFVTAQKDGKAVVTVEPAASFDTSIYVKNDSCGNGSQIMCGEAGGAGKTETVTFNVTAGTVYTVAVDGKGGSTGTYKISFNLLTGTCGNNIPEQGEACDDGNTNGGDGCGPSCTQITDDPPSGNTCPGQPVHVWNVPVIATGTMSDYADMKQSETCPEVGGNQPGFTQPEHIYAVTAHKTGTMNVLGTTSDNTFNFVLYARTVCDNQSTEVACKNETGAGGGESLTFPVEDGKTYMVAIDGVGSGDRGPFQLTFSIP